MPSLRNMFEPADKPVLIAPSDGAEGALLPPPRRGSGLAHLVSGRPRARPAGCRRSSRMLDAWSVSSCRRPRIGQRRRVEEEGYRPEMPKAASGLKTLAACRIELLIGDEIRGPLRVDPPPAGSDRASTRRRACGKCRQSCSSFPSTNTWQGRLRGGWTAVLLREARHDRARMRCGGRQVFAKGGEHGGTSGVAFGQTLSMRAPFKL